MSETRDQLVELAKNGDLRAFDRLVALHQGKVYALACRILGNPDDASDVQQETFLRAWRSIHKFRHEAAFSTWLHRITVNLCLSRKRRREYIVYLPEVDDQVGDGTGECPVFSLERTDRIAIVRRALAAMPLHHRMLIVLRDMEGRAYEDISEILGCSVDSVRTRLCKARKLLRERIRPYLEDEYG